MADYPDSHRDLLNGDLASLSTIGRDDFPQVTAIWFLLDDDGQVRFSINSGRQKLKNLQERPACTLFIIDPQNLYRTLEIRARAELTPDPNYEFADKIGRKYGADLRTMDGPGQTRVMVTLMPVKVNAIDLSG